MSMTNNLPLGWCECVFGDVGYLQNGYAFNSKKYTDNGFNLIRISDIQNDKITFEKCVKVTEIVDDCYKVCKNDFLIAMSGATTGKTGVYNYKEHSLLNQRVGNLKVYSERILSLKFRNYFLMNKRKEIESLAYGGAQPNISKTMIENLSVLLPPLNEQKRIVEKIEELFTQIDNSVESLKLAQNQIKQYKQSVLKSAFEGKLYKTTEWESVILSDVCSINPKTDIPSIKDDEQVSFLPMPAVIAEINQFNEDIALYGKVKKGYTKFKNKDVLFAKITPCMENGKTCVVDNLKYGIGFGSTEFHVLRGSDLIIPTYIFYYIAQQQFRKTAKGFMTGAVGQKRISADYLKKVIIPLPSLPEQEKIVEEIEKRFSVADELLKQVEKGLESAQKLKQSILKKAFLGKLVPQNPTDEPASELLKRIKTQNLTKKKGKK